jgi:GTP:adenosylcobinamide-phosphate guanylyltransferase
MDAVITAGGIPLPEEPLYEQANGDSKALIDIAGKPMVQWVLDALSQAETIENVVVVGLSSKSGVTCTKPLTFLSNQGKMLANIQAGAHKVSELNPEAEHFLIVSSDIPAISGEMVDWVVNTAMETDDDVYYNVIRREDMEKRFPTSKRTYTRLKDVQICGGDMNVARISLVDEESDFWEKVINTRKSPLAQAALIGFDTLLLVLFRRLTLEQVALRVMRRLDLTGRAILCPYPEVGMDIDKPHQLELLRKDLEKSQKRKKNKAE